MFVSTHHSFRLCPLLLQFQQRINRIQERLLPSNELLQPKFLFSNSRIDGGHRAFGWFCRA